MDAIRLLTLIQEADPAMSRWIAVNRARLLPVVEQALAARRAKRATPAQRFAARVRAVVAERGLPYANMVGTSGIHSEALRALDVDDPEAASAGRVRGQADELVSDAMIEAGVTPAWNMPFPRFYKRTLAIPPGLLDTPRIHEVAGLAEEKAAEVQVEEAKAKVAGTKEGRTALDNEGHSWFREPEGKAAAKAWAAYKKAKDHASDVRERWREYQQWQLWMATRKHARARGYTPIAHDETPPPVRER